MSISGDSPSNAGNSQSDIHVRVQLEPVQVDGITAATLGTGMWTLAFVLALIFNSRLIAHGHSDWKWIALAGVFLGFLAQIYTRRRVKRLNLVN